MSGLLLTDAERQRFVAWLELEAASGKAMIEQLEKMGAVTAPLLVRERQECAAALVLIQKLSTTEAVTIEAQP